MSERADRYVVAREALAQLAMPVAIIGAEADGRRSCATGTAMYVSFAPPRVAIAQHPGSRTTALIEASGRFSVSLLRDAQLAAAVDAGSGARSDDKFGELGIGTVTRDGTAPAVAGSAAILWCEVVSVTETGDHRLFIGNVTAYQVGNATDPLLRHRRRYVSLGTYLSDEAPEGYPT
jgi:flavin reductase (DIM6/NTAB) family NADH-FMN oxidoreductase RutF